MSWYCTVASVVLCPRCRKKLFPASREVLFQWGKVPEAYAIGDTIRWLTDREGRTLPPFRLVKIPIAEFVPLMKEYAWNCGEPQYKDVLLFDPEVRDLNRDERVCPSCKYPFDAVAVCICGGSVHSIRVFAEGEVREALGPDAEYTDIVIVRNDGSYWPRIDWNEPAFSGPS